MEKKNPVLKHQAACYTESNMKSEKGWNPEKKKNKKEKRREVRKEESVGRKSMTKKKMTERTSPPQTLPRCYHWHSLRKKKKSNGASRTRKWPRQISTKKKGRGLTGNYLGWLRHSLHNIGCDSPKKKKTSFVHTLWYAKYRFVGVIIAEALQRGPFVSRKGCSSSS